MEKTEYRTMNGPQGIRTAVEVSISALARHHREATAIYATFGSLYDQVEPGSDLHRTLDTIRGDIDRSLDELDSAITSAKNLVDRAVVAEKR